MKEENFLRRTDIKVVFKSKENLATTEVTNLPEEVVTENKEKEVSIIEEVEIEITVIIIGLMIEEESVVLKISQGGFSKTIDHLNKPLINQY
jgi:hypothetical protein